MRTGDLQQQLNDMKESLDLLILENDEKDKYIQEMEVEIKEKTHHSDFLAQGAKIATQEAAEREQKLEKMRLEKDMKEREAAEHLAEVESKAKRVDELEKQMVLLNMDKDKLKAENNKLTDQVMSLMEMGGGSGTGGGGSAVKNLPPPGISVNPLTQSTKAGPFGVNPARQSAPLDAFFSGQRPSKLSEKKG